MLNIKFWLECPALKQILLMLEFEADSNQQQINNKSKLKIKWKTHNKFTTLKLPHFFHHSHINAQLSVMIRSTKCCKIYSSKFHFPVVFISFSQRLFCNWLFNKDFSKDFTTSFIVCNLAEDHLHHLMLQACPLFVNSPLPLQLAKCTHPKTSAQRRVLI